MTVPLELTDFKVSSIGPKLFAVEGSRIASSIPVRTGVSCWPALLIWPKSILAISSILPGGKGDGKLLPL